MTIYYKFCTYIFLILLQDDDLLLCTLYAHHPVQHGILHKFLPLHFKIIFILPFIF